MLLCFKLVPPQMGFCLHIQVVRVAPVFCEACFDAATDGLRVAYHLNLVVLVYFQDRGWLSMLVSLRVLIHTVITISLCVEGDF